MKLRDNLPAGLLEDVKAECDITWTDEATDTKVRGHIASGMIYLNKKYGGPADYIADGLPRTLLMQYVRYARDSALDIFENNYRSMILDLQHEGLVKRYVENAEQAE